jgi:hypothetical protein
MKPPYRADSVAGGPPLVEPVGHEDCPNDTWGKDEVFHDDLLWQATHVITGNCAFLIITYI